ncbi:class I SAM-dependent methyltransferase [Acuticoccus kandeliae]|uniref:class I SAM-dependent methyltransferase n=1 Tax=Acuticoccus kandeliae TaxID=2073160 RepID=UPI000D3E3467|nr:class I SAM-dependent methyltransferase [Acuticoccus kandeliae]
MSEAGDDEGGWRRSASAWIESLGDPADSGDFGRRHVLDAPMLARATRRPRRRALDVGCGEGRFCRMLAARGIETVGIDPTPALLDEARRRDPAGRYVPGRAEALDFPDASFDLVVSYLTLIDIPDVPAAVAEMARILAPGGALLVANITPMATANASDGWVADANGVPRYPVDRYLEAFPYRAEWRGIDVINWHRPLSLYMEAFLGAGLHLVHFTEPRPSGGPADIVARYERVPWFLIMEWEAPAAA